jgi:hypothetical protein
VRGPDLGPDFRDVVIVDLADGSSDGLNGSKPQRAREDDETTELAALTQVAVVREHKAIIGNARDLAISAPGLAWSVKHSASLRKRSHLRRFPKT